MTGASAGRRLATAGLALAALFAAPAVPGPAGGVALAHASLVASSPAAGEVLAGSPAELRLVFNEPLETQGTSLELRDADGGVMLSDAGEIDPDDPYALIVDDFALDDGVYTVTWRTLSAADGHTAQGFFSFGVGDVDAVPAADSGVTSHEADPLAVVGRWLTYAGLLLAFGAAAFHRVVLRGGRLARDAARLLAVALGTAAAAGVVTAVASGVEAGGVLDYLLGTRNGALQLGRAAVAALGAFLLLVGPQRASVPVAAGAGLVGIALHVAAGHAAAQPSPIPVLGHFIHVAAAAVWFGGIGSLLVLMLRPEILTGGPPGPPLREIVPRFSALALVSVGLIAASGAYAAWVQTGRILPLDTEYGRLVVMKSVFFLGAGALGAVNYLDGGRMRTWVGSFRSRLSLEVLVAGVVLMITGVLAATPPGAGGGTPIEPVPDAFGRVAPDMAMEVIPGRPGINRIDVATTDALAGIDLEIVLDRVDTGSSTRVPLTPAGETGGGEAPAHAGHGAATAPGAAEWYADAVVLPADSQWETSVRLLSDAGTELSRQRFGFVMESDGIGEGRMTDLVTPAVAIAALMLLVGAIAMGLGVGGASLPLTDRSASRVALLAGGAASLVLAVAIGVEHLTRL